MLGAHGNLGYCALLTRNHQQLFSVGYRSMFSCPWETLESPKNRNCLLVLSVAFFLALKVPSKTFVDYNCTQPRSSGLGIPFQGVRGWKMEIAEKN